MKMQAFVGILLFASTGLAVQAASLEPIHENCTISVGDKADTLRLQLRDGDCPGRERCGNNMSDVPLARFTGVSLSELTNEGAHLTATLNAEAGSLTCTGTVHGNELDGSAVFTPDAGFVARMKDLGFTGFDSEKLLACAFLNVESAWAKSLKQAGVPDMTTDNLMGLRVFNVDAAYVHGIMGLGYPMPTADQLVAMKCQGVNAEEVKEIRALGYQPNFDQLVQIRIFKVTPEFIRRMQARGFKDLSLDKLVQIRIFNLAD